MKPPRIRLLYHDGPQIVRGGIYTVVDSAHSVWGIRLVVSPALDNGEDDGLAEDQELVYSDDWKYLLEGPTTFTVVDIAGLAVMTFEILDVPGDAIA